MTHKTEFRSETGIIETRLQGTIHFNEVKEVISESTSLAKEHQCYLWLTDYSEATPQLSTWEIYDLPKLFAEAAAVLDVLPFQIIRAIIVSNDQADYPFARTISKNRGQSLELFHNLEKARAWLTNR